MFLYEFHDSFGTVLCKSLIDPNNAYVYEYINVCVSEKRMKRHRLIKRKVGKQLREQRIKKDIKPPRNEINSDPLAGSSIEPVLL